MWKFRTVYNFLAPMRIEKTWYIFIIVIVEHHGGINLANQELIIPPPYIKISWLSF